MPKLLSLWLCKITFATFYNYNYDIFQVRWSNLWPPMSNFAGILHVKVIKIRSFSTALFEKN